MGIVSDYLFRKLINVEPTVSKEGQLLVIKSSWRAHVLSLGGASRKITVDPVSKIIRMKGRRFWFFGWSKFIEFDWVQEILYGYWSTGASYNGLGLSGLGALGYGEYTQDEMFTIALKLKNNTQVTLCRFFGSGDFVNNTFMPDWWYWEDQMVANATHGTQEQNSSALVDVLSRLIGVPVTNPRP